MKLDRRLGLFQSTIINMIDMVGIGPFVVMPLVISLMGGPWFMYAWFFGALLSFIDAMIWAELGAAYPQAGGSFNFLRAAYGEEKWGRLFSFLYVWQTMIQGPLVIASGAIGFAHYFGYLVPLDAFSSRLVSGSVVILITMLLYRKIETIGKISILLWFGVIVTMLTVISSGISHGDLVMPLLEMNSGLNVDSVFAAALGAATVKTIYSYLGYYNVCHLGSEIEQPEKNIPRSMFLSVLGIAVLYLLMNLSVVSVIPWQEAMHSEFVVSLFMEKLYGQQAAVIITALILWVAFASLFAVMLGYSRVPYAAAEKGEFFSIFSKLHPKRNFPYVAVLGLGMAGFIFSLFFKLSTVITAILAMRILVQFIGQSIGIFLLSKRNGRTNLPWKMPLYPLPVILAIGIWTFIFFSTGTEFMLSGLLVIISGVFAFLIKAGLQKHWPFTNKN